MYAFRTFVAALPVFGLVANAAPLTAQLEARSVNSTIAKRDLPIFFGFDSAPDRRARAEQAFRDALTLARSVLQAPRFDETFNTYFDGSGDKDEILEVFREILGADIDGTGSSVFAQLVVDNTDNGGGCQGNVVAFIENSQDAGDNRGSLTLCEKAYAFPDLSEKDCGSLSSTVSTLMSTLGGVILHELTHFKAIGLGALGELIVDHGQAGYGPLNVRTLRTNDPAAARLNADSYRWYAQEVYWSNRCGRAYSGPRDNRDTGDSACGGSTCEIM